MILGLRPGEDEEVRRLRAMRLTTVEMRRSCAIVRSPRLQRAPVSASTGKMISSITSRTGMVANAIPSDRSQEVGSNSSTPFMSVST